MYAEVLQAQPQATRAYDSSLALVQASETVTALATALGCCH